MTYRSASFLLIASLALPLGACSALVSDTSWLSDAGSGGHGDMGTGGHDGGGDGSTRDSGPGCPASCDDGIPCTHDSCDAASGACVHVPQDSMCPGMRCSALMGCVPAACTTDASCDDANACNGQETCHPGMPGADPTSGCVPGTALDCNDHADCTLDACNPSSGCTHTPNDAACDDGLSCTRDTCMVGSGCHHEADSTMCNGMCGTGATCSLTGPAPSGCSGGTMITCMSDGNPCTSDPPTCDPTMGCLHPPRDNDGDGHPTARALGAMGLVTCPGGDDCDDSNPDVHPGAVEVCNGIDDNCDGNIDEGGVCGGGPPPNDDCSGAIPITLVGTGVGGGARAGTASGTTTTANDDYITMCSRATSGSGPDVVYSIDVPPPGATAAAYDVVVTTRSATGGTTFDTVLGISASPCGDFNLCNDDSPGGGTTASTITFCSVGGVTDYILVDGFGPTDSGSFMVSVTVTPRAIPCG